MRSTATTPARPVATLPRTDDGHTVTGIPLQAGQRLFFASFDVLRGRLDDAERALTPLAEIPADEEGARAVATRAEGALVVLNAQRKRLDELATHRRRYRELVGPRMNPATATNYLTLVRMLAARGIPLVAVGYPARDAQPLRDLLADRDNVVVVDNEETFIQASIEQPLKDVYIDLFAGIFGHMTASGHDCSPRTSPTPSSRSSGTGREPSSQTRIVTRWSNGAGASPLDAAASSFQMCGPRTSISVDVKSSPPKRWIAFACSRRIEAS